jgi:ABC-2 type transport system permease protein
MTAVAFNGGVTQSRVVRSEWTKLRTLRSSRISLAVAFGCIVALGLIISTATMGNWNHFDAHERASFDPVLRSIGGVYLAQLAFLVLGVLFVTGEYSTGMIRASFAAVPRRLPVLWAKLLVYVSVTLVLATVSCLLAFWGGQAIFVSHHVNVALGDPGVTRAVLGAALYLTVVSWLAVSIGSILRNTAGGIAALAGILFVLPPLMSLLPASWDNTISPYLPSNAGQALFLLHPDGPTLAPWTGFGVFCAYAAVATAAAAVLLVRRDA